MELTQEEKDAVREVFLDVNVPLATFLKRLRNDNIPENRVRAIGDFLYGEFIEKPRAQNTLRLNVHFVNSVAGVFASKVTTPDGQSLPFHKAEITYDARSREAPSLVLHLNLHDHNVTMETPCSPGANS